ncbi:hypothetical protein B0I33_1094 [Prauserella shujinwangii]|uniref:Uncharacterized protein n=1 Tax=Prauserella shujinwangii TaxID=1453103 RepID=A0A2T0LPS1_9PSEU|nr:hypothetical protein [Prauserella shujinwangii]PRX43841.1 hypothetical protein B0I33_1134 [Prauserella shujinwangii]PRX45343.1 hypothetical protein B0I33_1094 [Prauserella shujinwangii]
MSTFDVLARYGTAALLRFAGAVVLFLLLHLARIPLVLAARVLEVAMRRLDGYATRQASQPPRGPINHYFDREVPA